MDPVLELQGAIIQRLRSFPVLVSLIGQRSYDNPPTNDQGQVSPSIFPYVSIGASSAQQVDAVWSIEPAKKQMRDVTNAVRLATRGWVPVLTANALVTFDYWRTDYIQDGAINHASIRYTAIIEQP
jgi:hypothetical protein